MAKSATQIRIDEKLFEKIKLIAELELRTMNAQIEYFLLNGVTQYENENGSKLLISGYHDSIQQLEQ